MKIAILGYGIEGKSALKYLKKKYPQAEIEIRDRKFGDWYLKGLDKYDLVVRSPGIPYLNHEIQKAVKKGVLVTSPTRLFFEGVLRYGKGKIIGVTGTKGKGTVSTLLFQMLNAEKKDAYLVGNIGKPALDILSKMKKDSIAVFELSSFQLQDLSNSPQIAVVLDISPDHLDYHKNFKEYVEAKFGIALYQKAEDAIFYFSDNEYSGQIAAKSPGKKIAISNIDSIGDGVINTHVIGRHNVRNFLMAGAVAKYIGCSEGMIERVLKDFKGLPHRLEFVDRKNDVIYVDDSASTNPAALAAAVLSFKEPVVLIAGGADKKLDYKILESELKGSSLKEVVLFGKNARKLKNVFSKFIPVKLVADLEKAILHANSIAGPGSVVLLSPGSASFDMFENASQRGDKFKELVDKL